MSRSNVSIVLDYDSQPKESVQLTREALYIRSNIEMCTCVYFIPDLLVTKEAHQTIQGELPPSTEWQTELHTITQKTNAYGDIQFVRNGNSVSKFVRCHSNDEVSDLLELLNDYWNLDRPNLIISVTGGAKSFSMNPHLTEQFNRGITCAAATTGSWIITGGLNTGVMKFVGSAVKEYTLIHGNKNKIVNIGIAPWGTVRNKELLINANGSYPIKYTGDGKAKKGDSPLDPNHSHFILVDNGTELKFRGEINLRNRLEAGISNMYDDDYNNFSIPVVMVVLEGGVGTLETVAGAIHNQIPAVIVEGSGRAADIICYVYENSVESEVKLRNEFDQMMTKTISIVEKSVWEECRKRIIAEFTENNIENNMNMMREIFQSRDHINVYRLDVFGMGNSVDYAILNALLRVNKSKTMDQLRLALAWNRIDIAKSEIFANQTKWDQKDLEEIAFTAIIENKTEFVKLCIYNGLNLSQFLTMKRLLRLYNEAAVGTVFVQILERQSSLRKQKSGFYNFADIGYSLIHLIGSFYTPLYFKDKYYHINVFDLVYATESKIIDGTSDTDIVFDFNYPERELFIWALVNQHFDLCMLFWENCPGRLAASLFGELICKSFIRSENDINTLAILNKQLNLFHDIAIGTLNSCYNTDVELTLKLLVKPIPEYSGITIISWALFAENQHFIAHAASQLLINNIWMGSLSPQNSAFALMLSAVVPFLIYPMITFDSDVKMKMKSSESKQIKRSIIKKQESEKKNHIRKSESVCKISYVTFLMIYSIMLLTQFETNPSILEYVIIGWVITLLFEEIRQVAFDNSTELLSRKARLASYLNDVWNILDVIIVVTFTIAVIFRFILVLFVWSRVIYATNLVIFYLRILSVFSIHKQLGPKVVMIGRMFIDLSFFMLILFVFIVAYGVALQSTLYPNSTLDVKLVQKVLRVSYWQMYGELFLDELEGKQTCTNQTSLVTSSLPRCVDPSVNWLTPIMLGLYILITQVLMFNLVIAMFSYTFSKIQDNTDLHWHFSRFQLIKEYHNKPKIPPPIIILTFFKNSLKFIYKKCCKNSTARESHFVRYYNETETSQIDTFENLNATLKRNARAVDWIIQSMIEKGAGNKQSLPDLKDVDHKRMIEKELYDKNMTEQLEKFKNELMEELNLHTKSRTPIYPSISHEVIYRTCVPNKYVNWNKKFQNYDPVYYTDQFLTYSKSPKVDPEINLKAKIMTNILFNKMDTNHNVDRNSFIGEYFFQNNYPINPKGRTGMTGRGILFRWGPNHVSNCIITRCKINKDNEIEKIKDKQLLEFMIVERRDNGELAIPEFFINTKNIIEMNKNKFIREIYSQYISDDKFNEKINSLFKNNKEIYRGYSDDPRNTDNAWIETAAYHYHDEDNVLDEFQVILKPSQEYNNVKWEIINSKFELFASHRNLCKKVAQNLDAHF
ncbi:hypothetical protein A3Q56_00397 [Intoshia linei]|uniref:Transient receptor potential cation channel subfamily M member 2 n=1 Tax=Intoshia linei TaxID=1819745 RepID=A0A177BBZ8_9BILA|nr:hypothetical protein A3Q56_00397 [Intoshia linei]